MREREEFMKNVSEINNEKAIINSLIAAPQHLAKPVDAYYSAKKGGSRLLASESVNSLAYMSAGFSED